MNMNYEELWLE